MHYECIMERLIKHYYTHFKMCCECIRNVLLQSRPTYRKCMKKWIKIHLECIFWFTHPTVNIFLIHLQCICTIYGTLPECIRQVFIIRVDLLSNVFLIHLKCFYTVYGTLLECFRKVFMYKRIKYQMYFYMYVV